MGERGFWAHRQHLVGCGARRPCATGRLFRHQGRPARTTHTVALEYARKGITCNAVLPGMVETENVKAMPQEIREAAMAATPVRRWPSGQDRRACRIPVQRRGRLLHHRPKSTFQAAAISTLWCWAAGMRADGERDVMRPRKRASSSRHFVPLDSDRPAAPDVRE